MKATGQSSARAMMWFRLVLVLGSLWGGLGCKPKIGEDCATSVDCSLSGDRLCDITQPGGYCTVFNCEPNNCPDEAVCVAFGEGTCSAAASIRFRRTFCMRTCEDDSDCRGGSYRCVDVARDPSRRIVDSNPSSRRICSVPSSQTPPASDTPIPEPGVCFPSDASFDVSRPETGPISRDAPTDADATEVSTVDALDSSPTETGTDAPSDRRADTSNDVVGDTVDDAAEEPEAALSPP